MRANTSVKARSSSTGSAVSASLSAIADRLTVSAAPARTPARPTSKNFAFCVISLHPKEGINRTALVPHFKIQAGVGLAAAVADGRNRVTGLDPFAHLLIQTFIITVQTHIALPMVHDAAIALTAEPGVARMNRPLQLTPPSSLGVPKRFISSPATGRRSEPFRLEKGCFERNACG